MGKVKAPSIGFWTRLARVAATIWIKNHKSQQNVEAAIQIVEEVETLTSPPKEEEGSK